MVSVVQNLQILDSLISNLNESNNYSETLNINTNSAPLLNCNFVRILSNQKCLINCNLIKTNYLLDLTIPPDSNNISLTNSSIVEAGNENLWYKTIGTYIPSVTISLYSRNSLLTGPISLELQFLSNNPSVYTENA